MDHPTQLHPHRLPQLLFWGTLLVIGTGCKAPGHFLHRAGIDPYHYTVEKDKEFSHGAVVTAHPLASKAGVAMLKKGGNAIDAAIATQLALAVVYPGAGNIGGGGFLVAHLSDGRNLTLDFREAAPGRAHRDMYLDDKGNVIPGLSENGHLASGVPGTIAGLFEALPYARLPFKTLIQPAIELAEKGFVINAAEARGLNATQKEFTRNSSQRSAFINDKGW
ncbi:MAG: gamma-glutamyltransferase, partial [Bacteroidota bacterium]